MCVFLDIQSYTRSAHRGVRWRVGCPAPSLYQGPVAQLQPCSDRRCAATRVDEPEQGPSQGLPPLCDASRMLIWLRSVSPSDDEATK